MKIIDNMQYTIQPPQHINTTITLPASKSVCNRALVIQALAGGRLLPANLSDCDDTRVIAAALRDMPETIDIGAAGTAMRFLTAYLSVTHGCHTITGTERMRHRPIGVLVDALRRLGADISYLGAEGYPPLAICGRAIEGGSLSVPGNVSSQYISALLMIGPMLRRGLELRLEGDIVSRPYIDLTLWTMTEFGAKAEWSDVDTITVAPVPYQPSDYAVENDWSAASYWYEMLALCDDNEPRVVLPGLMDGSRQGDTICRYIGSLMGVKTTFGTGDDGTPQVVLSHQHRRLPRLDYDFVSSPDLVQTFVVACAMRGIPFHFTGLASLRIKETDRIEALKRELRKLGVVLTDRNDSELIWNLERCEPTMEPIDTYQDHRMAMAFAPAALALGSITINDPEVVSKSYPHYWDDLRRAGFQITKRP